MKICSPEELSPEQALILKEYTRFFPPGAVCVNLILGAEEWDLRPLLLIAGRVSIARFSGVLASGVIRRITAQIEEISALSDSPHSIYVLPGGERFMMLRQYQPDTVLDLLNREGELTAPLRRQVVNRAIELIAKLGDNRLTHGHISPSNLALVDGRVILLDPLIGSLSSFRDSFFAPENTTAKPPDAGADLYSLGLLIRNLFGDSMSSREAALIEELKNSSPSLRPKIEDVAQLFGVTLNSIEMSRPNREEDREMKKMTSGRLIKANNQKGSREEPRSSNEFRDLRDTDTTMTQVGAPVAKVPTRNGYLFKGVFIIVAILGVAGWILKERDPVLYFEIVSRFPILAAQYSAEYEAEWSSRDRIRMASVGRAAVMRREPAAINTIANDLTAGSNPEGANGALIRVALSDSWIEELKPSDKHTALIFALEGLVPEGRSQFSYGDSIHSGVLLAILGQANSRAIPSILKEIEIERLTGLPAPFGELFSQVRAMGVRVVGESTALGLAQIVTGNTKGESLQNFLGNDNDPARTMAKVALIAPILSASPSAASELLNFLTERGGELTTLIGWFELEDLAAWNRVKASDKIQLILGNEPQENLNLAQLSDLLTFPIDKIRGYAVQKLNKLFVNERSRERVLVTLATPTLGLSREETIAIISALNLPPEGRTPFIAAWFNLNPNPNAVLLLLLARSDADTNDLFNLEATRYLKRSEWGGTLDVFRLLVIHPEPLARALAYGKLDPAVEAERTILLERQGVEKDEACQKILNQRLAASEVPGLLTPGQMPAAS